MEKRLDWQYELLTYLSLFLVLWVFMWAVRQLYPTAEMTVAELQPYKGVLPEKNPYLEVWQRWDTLHYQAIAERGYLAFENALFVPPLYPFLMRGLGKILGNTLLAGLLISNLFGIAAIFAFRRLVCYEYDEQTITRRAPLYLLSFPTAFFIFAAYTESLFLLGAILLIYYLRQRKWILAGLWGAVAALARLPGALIVLPALYEAWQVWRQSGSFRPWLAPVLVSLGAAVFPLYIWLGLGLSPLAPLTTQTSRFHGGLTVPGWNIIMAVRQIWAGIYPVTNSLDLFFTLLFIGGAIAVAKQMPKVYVVYTLSFMALYLFRIAAVYPLLSNSRYVLVLFPVFMLAAHWGEKAWVNRLILYTSWTGLIFLAAEFAIWGWVG